MSYANMFIGFAGELSVVRVVLSTLFESGFHWGFFAASADVDTPAPGSNTSTVVELKGAGAAFSARFFKVIEYDEVISDSLTLPHLNSPACILIIL